MAEKKIYFYGVNLYKVEGEELLPFTQLKPIMVDIINKNAIEIDDHKTLDLGQNEDGLHLMMDIFNYEGDKLFCRLSKQKPNNSMLQRNYQTAKCSDVVPQNEIGNKGIEIYTYGCIDYSTGIYSYISAQSAPSERIISEMFFKYKYDYKIEMTSIPNADAIDTIYYGNAPEISKIEIEIPVPNDDVMQQVFHWKEPEIINAVTKNAIKAEIIVYAPTRGKLVSDEDAKKVIEQMKEFRAAYRNAKLTAKTNGSKTKEYDLYARFFSYSIDIPKYHIRDRKRVEYTIEELTIMYRENLYEAFETNKMGLKALLGR